MIRFKLKEMIAKKEFSDGERVTVAAVAEATGIHRMTISKLINHRGTNTGTDNVSKLCEYFDCKVEDLIEYVPDRDIKEID
ncbi:transcriptional regulator [Oleiphilus sp. HI0079]|uniref:helix-turn-helix domain-containing protein n=1 Tax=Oleiphilus sp. HI0079 TaxID=1822254 RepID=UPI0007C26979|nr:helix-turn-helix transcriptional regulator [Oleiphilus sp. HI0079]KZZ13465.1 transcriptional regulator [Oleiphilus sp. HI0079]KZZ15075.1 transcriptional regulator [Oleiphilus sp. HI0079]